MLWSFIFSPFIKLFILGKDYWPTPCFSFKYAYCTEKFYMMSNVNDVEEFVIICSTEGQMLRAVEISCSPPSYNLGTR